MDKKDSGRVASSVYGKKTGPFVAAPVLIVCEPEGFPVELEGFE